MKVQDDPRCPVCGKVMVRMIGRRNFIAWICHEPHKESDL